MTDASTTQAEPQGIGGWLVLPMLGTIISPLVSAIGLFQNIDALVKYRDVQTAVWSYVVIGEIVFTLAIIAGWIFAAVMLFKHKRIFPALFVFMLGAVLVLNLADIVAVKAILNQDPDAQSIRDVIRPFVSLVIWGPYMYLSKRVKNTFVN
jgi:Protein of unknown function (DUF2569)